MENKKMTNKMALEWILENTDLTSDVKEKVVSMIEALDRKSSANRKPTATQKENEHFKELIMLTIGTEGKTVTEIMKSIPEFDGLANQKISALVKQLVDAQKLTRTSIKGRSYFAKA